MLYFKELQDLEFVDKWSQKLRLQDKIEIGAIYQDENYIKDVIKNAFEKSHVKYLLYNDSEIMSIYGIKNINKRIGMPWFLSVDIPKSVTNDFFKITREIIDAFKKDYDVLYNFTYYNNLTSHKWLEFLGFKIIHEDVIEKHDGRKLVKFEWRKEWGNY